MGAPNVPEAPAGAGVLVDLLGRYLPPGYIESLIRTWVPIGIGAVLAWVAVHWHIAVSRDASATVGVVAGALVVAGYYAVARLVERRWPTVGRWLIALNLVRTAPPLYARPDEAVRVVNAAGDVRRE